MRGSLTHGSRLIDGSAGLVTGRLVASGVNAIWLVVLARHLAVSDFADLVLILSVAALATSITEGGLQFAVAAHAARLGSFDVHAVGKALRRREVILLGTSPLVIVTLWALMPSRDALAAALILPSVFATPVYQMVLSARRGLGRLGAEAINESASRLFVLVAGLVVVLLGGRLRAVVALYSVADLVSAAIIWRRAKLRWGGTETAPIDLGFAATSSLAGLSIIGTVMQRIDVVLLAALGSPADVARVGVISRIYEAVQLPAQGVAASTVHHAVHEDGRGVALRRLLVRSAGATAAVAITVSVLAQPLLRELFGPAYEPAAGALRVFGLAAFVAAFVAVLLPMVALHRRHSAMLCVLAALAVVVAGDLLLIPRFGLGGVAVTSVAAQLVALVLLGQALRVVNASVAQPPPSLSAHSAGLA